MATRRTSDSEKEGAKKAGKGGRTPPPDPFENAGGEPAALHEVTRTRYLNYALSVITSRALPDVRDGLKPVQRRILYTMWQQRLTAEAKHRKCAKVVGDVMGNYHPHGDASIYDALVRVAQTFSMRLPLVDGSGNFGSLDGDPAAAMRYTECRLAPAAGELLGELNQDTVHFRPNYDGTRTEPVVLPAKLPNLLVNGATGIAVGMATNVPPHNPEEVCQASIRLLDALLEDKDISSRELCRTVKGPDFPTGGQIVTNPEELKQIYETGQGTIKVRGTWTHGPESKSVKKIHITSIPYTVNKSVLVERIADVVTGRKMPLLLDVRDISTDDVCIELDLKKDAEEQKVLAYLYKNTPLQTNFAVNMTCLVPTENPEVGRPERLDLRQMLWHFLHFRMEVVTRRLEHELGALQKRIHILEGFETIFDALDEILKIIRSSEGKADAAQKIIKRFKLDEEQTDAILELKLYRLAKLEILVIQKELKEKRKRSAEIRSLLNEKSGGGRWGIVRGELTEVATQLKTIGGKRRTSIESVGDEPEFTAEDLIVEEDNHVLVTTDGWVKRAKEIKDPAASRLREGDSVLACVAGSTRSTVVFFSNLGTAYTCRFVDVVATTGYGEPIQKLFKLKDGEKIISAYSLDRRLTGDITEKEGYYPETFGFAATSDGNALCFGLSAFAEPSTKAGRRYAKPVEGAHVVSATLVTGEEKVVAVSEGKRVLCCTLEEVSYLTSAGKGVMLMKLEDSETLLTAVTTLADKPAVTLKTSLGGEQQLTFTKKDIQTRGGKGNEIIKRGKFAEIVRDPVAAPTLPPPPEK